MIELIGKLADVCKKNPDMEVGISIQGEGILAESEMNQDAKTGDIIGLNLDIDEYSEEISVKRIKVGDCDKACICARIG